MVWNNYVYLGVMVLLNKEKVKELYIKGYGFTTIAKILNAKPETVRKCIQRNFKEFKNSHEAAKLADKEIKRITRHEAKQYMSDRDFVIRNRSIYKTNVLTGDIKLNKESINAAIPFDVPRSLINENKICV